jgi:hypothetical protein
LEDLIIHHKMKIKIKDFKNKGDQSNLFHHFRDLLVHLIENNNFNEILIYIIINLNQLNVKKVQNLINKLMMNKNKVSIYIHKKTRSM